MGRSVRPIEGVGTAVAAFIGIAAEGPLYKPILVTNWSQFTQTFGGYLKGTYLSRAVQGYLTNGGQQCYVVRIGAGNSRSDTVPRVALTSGSDADPERGDAGGDSTGRDADDFGRDAAAGGTRDDGSRDHPREPPVTSALSALENLDEVTMVSVPDLMTAYQNNWIDMDSVIEVQLAIIDHCEQMADRIAILDSPPGLSVDQVVDWRAATPGFDSNFATLYWPWVKSLDPATGRHTFMPPCGHVAGTWSRSDATRGVHRAPANEIVSGVIDVEAAISPDDKDRLSAHGINTIQPFPGKGVRVSGARTLSSDAAWQRINVRRLVNYLEKSILNGTDWAASEPKDERLWGEIAQSVAGFLAMEWRKGVLGSAGAAQSFFVSCDSHNNPPEIAAAGQIVCDIGVAPVKPGEFVVFRLAKYPGGASTLTEAPQL